MYGKDSFCRIPKCTFEIPQKIYYPYIALKIMIFIIQQIFRAKIQELIEVFETLPMNMETCLSTWQEKWVFNMVIGIVLKLSYT